MTLIFIVTNVSNINVTYIFKGTKMTPEERNEWLEARKPNINSTDSSALFGLSPYKTLFSLWHEKKGNIEESFTPNERVILGQHLEDGIGEAFAEITGWPNEPFKDYLKCSILRYGSSFDRLMTSGPHKGSLLEIKLVDYLIFKDEWQWIAEGIGEAPPHIEVQVQHQLMVSGKDHCIILACVANELKWIYRKRDEEMINAIESEIADFWKSIEENREPSPNYAQDTSSLCRLYGKSADEEKTLTLEGEESENVDALLEQDKTWKSEIDKLTAMRQSLKAKIWETAGENGRIVTENNKVNLTLTKQGLPKKLTVTEDMVGDEIILSKPKSSYRQFRHSTIKRKKQ